MPGERDFLRDVAKQVTRDDEKLQRERLRQFFQRAIEEAPPAEQAPTRFEEEYPFIEREQPVEPGPPPSYPFIEGIETKPELSRWGKIERHMPWTTLGVSMYEPERIAEKEKIPPEYYKWMQQLPVYGAEKPALPPEIDPALLKEYEETVKRGHIIPTEEEYREYTKLPWYKQIAYELPFWVGTGILSAAAGGAIGIREALLPIVKGGGKKAAAAVVARVALKPVATIEQAIGYATYKPLQAILKRRWTVAQINQLQALDDKAFKQAIIELEAILKANPELAARATPQTIADIAWGMKQVLAAGPKFQLSVAERYGITETGPVSDVFAKYAARNLAKFVLEWGSPQKPQVVVDTLVKGGIKLEAIQGMTVETAWTRLVGILGLGSAIKVLEGIEVGVPAVAPPVEIKPAVPKPEVGIEKPYTIGQAVEIETPKGWIKGEVTSYRSGEVGEDFLRIDVKTAKRPYMGAHPKSIRPIGEVTLPKAEVGMPEPGLQAGALGVPSKIVTPLGRGEITQIRMEDYAKLIEAQMKELGIPEAYQFNVAKIDQRLAEVNKLLAVKGKLPTGKGTKAELSLEQATLETQRDIAGMIEEAGTDREGLVGFIDTAIAEVKSEIGLRGIPYHGRVSANLFPDKTIPQLDKMAKVYTDFKSALTKVERAPLPTPIKPVGEPRAEVLETTKKDTFIKSIDKGEGIVKAGSDIFNTQAEMAGLPPPNIPPGRVGHIGTGGHNSENSLYDMTNRIIPGEDAGRAALRLWAGTRKRMATEAIAWWKEGNRSLKGLGIGKTDGINQRLAKEDSYELFKALHGEGDVPAKFQTVFNDLKQLLDKEASDMLAFDPNFSRMLMAHPDYFPRGWRPPREMGRGRLGAMPGFLKPRVNASFTEMVESGWEPISWNPFDMVALRRIAGTEYREGQILITRLKTFSKAIAENDAPREGWRVPKVGPAFEGKPYVGEDGNAYMTPKVSVPTRIADILESTYGTKVEFRVAGVDVFKFMTGFGAFTKRAKLFMSLFQHIDFLTRDWMIAFMPQGIRHAEPLKFPSLAARVTASAISPAVRGALERRVLSGDPLYTDSTISLKMIADAGWELGQDEMLIRRDVRAQLETAIKETENWDKLMPARILKRRLESIAGFFESGLFDGVYRESQAYALEHVIVPSLRRLHPTWTDEQIAGSAAEEVNKQYSTLAVWQSVLQQPAVREVARALIFSSNETEAWIRHATSAVKGKNARYWRVYAIAMYIALAIAANAINLLSEKKPLPLDRYVPLVLGSPYSSMPGGLAYNDKFLSPRLPWDGRNGQPIYLDIVGQADTYLRWLLDPTQALTARVNVFPRALMNQIQGKDFWGRELKDIEDRGKQALLDLFMPIGGGNLAQAARLRWAPVGGVIPEAEGRIGIVGALVQATGLNIRAQMTNDMLDTFARNSGYLKADGTPVQNWDDLEPYQKQEVSKNEILQAELGLRAEAAVERNYPGSAGFAKLDELDQERITRGEILVAELVNDLGVEGAETYDIASTFRNEVSMLKREIANKKSQVDEDFELFKETGEIPQDPNKRALVEYYNIFEIAELPSGRIDWNRVNELEAQYREKWTLSQEAYVDRNIGLAEWGPLMQEYINAQKVISESGYWDAEEGKGREVFRLNHPEVESILTGKFYNYQSISGVTTIPTRPEPVAPIPGGVLEAFMK